MGADGKPISVQKIDGSGNTAVSLMGMPAPVLHAAVIADHVLQNKYGLFGSVSGIRTKLADPGSATLGRDPIEPMMAGRDLSAQWRKLSVAASRADALQAQYRTLDQNSNTYASTVIELAGMKPLAGQTDRGQVWVPAQQNRLHEINDGVIFSAVHAVARAPEALKGAASTVIDGAFDVAGHIASAANALNPFASSTASAAPLKQSTLQPLTGGLAVMGMFDSIGSTASSGWDAARLKLGLREPTYTERATAIASSTVATLKAAPGAIGDSATSAINRVQQGTASFLAHTALNANGTSNPVTRAAADLGAMVSPAKTSTVAMNSLSKVSFGDAAGGVAKTVVDGIEAGSTNLMRSADAASLGGVNVGGVMRTVGSGIDTVGGVLKGGVNAGASKAADAVVGTANFLGAAANGARALMPSMPSMPDFSLGGSLRAPPATQAVATPAATARAPIAATSPASPVGAPTAPRPAAPSAGPMVLPGETFGQYQGRMGNAQGQGGVQPTSFSQGNGPTVGSRYNAAAQSGAGYGQAPSSGSHFNAQITAQRQAANSGGADQKPTYKDHWTDSRGRNYTRQNFDVRKLA
jgi:hypothetical protein